MKTETGRMAKQKQYEMVRALLIYRHIEMQGEKSYLFSLYLKPKYKAASVLGQLNKYFFLKNHVSPPVIKTQTYPPISH